VPKRKTTGQLRKREKWRFLRAMRRAKGSAHEFACAYESSRS
jgi:hypothetical protein